MEPRKPVLRFKTSKAQWEKDPKGVLETAKKKAGHKYRAINIKSENGASLDFVSLVPEK